MFNEKIRGILSYSRTVQIVASLQVVVRRLAPCNVPKLFQIHNLCIRRKHSAILFSISRTQCDSTDKKEKRNLFVASTYAPIDYSPQATKDNAYQITTTS